MISWFIVDFTYVINMICWKIVDDDFKQGFDKFCKFFNDILWTKKSSYDFKLHYIPHAWTMIFYGFQDQGIRFYDKKAFKPNYDKLSMWLFSEW